MAGGLDKGLSSSMWSPAMTGRSPYSSFRRSGLRTSTTAAYPSSPAPASTYPSSSSSGPNTPSNRTIDSASTPATRTTAATTPSPTRRCVDGPSDDDGAVDLLTAALGRIPTPWAELGRFTKIARRLKWKLPFLAHGYNAATAACVDGHGHGDEAGAAASMARAQRDEAELMFKLDFFEYYMLLERALVHLMGVFGIRITGGFGHGSSSKGGGSGSNGGGGGAGGGGGSSGGREVLVKTSDHRFHANVLEALDDVRNPLHESLGRDDVRYSLARAKELRNRWKNADDPDTALPNNNNNARTTTTPLTDYDLDRILQTIFAGLEAGFQVAQQFVDEVRALAAARRAGAVAGGGNNNMAGNNNIDMDMDAPEEEEVEWGFMTEAMDWESV